MITFWLKFNSLELITYTTYFYILNVFRYLYMK